MRSYLALVLAALTLTWGAPAGAATAPEPLKPVDPNQLYQGKWLEIARRPMLITDGCVAGSTTYARRADGKVDVLDACRRGGVTGKLAEIRGVGALTDPPTAAKLHVKYNLFVQWDYWILDHADDYSWFISANPQFDKLWIYTRKAPTQAQLDSLIARARALGYDTSRLEYPAQPGG